MLESIENIVLFLLTVEEQEDIMFIMKFKAAVLMPNEMPSSNLAILAATSQTGRVDLALKVAKDIELWDLIPYFLHPVYVGMKYSKPRIVDAFLSYGANREVIIYALQWAILKMPEYIPPLLSRYLEINEPEMYLEIAHFIRIAIENSAPMTAFIPLKGNIELIEAAEQTLSNPEPVLNFLES